MAARYFGLIPAAGTGSRFGGELPKQYQALRGRALLAYAVDALTLETPLLRVYVVHAEDDLTFVQSFADIGPMHERTSNPRTLQP